MNKKYICTICGYVYDESKEKVRFDDLPNDWKCPLCGAPKSAFKEVKDDVERVEEKKDVEVSSEDSLRELTDGELSAICSNLSKACDKQYLDKEKDLFMELSDYYKDRNEVVANGSYDDLLKNVKEDLDRFNNCKELSNKYGDRGSLRALTWSEKVTMILDAIMSKYGEDGKEMLLDNNIYVCDICGFVYIGKECPEICPICKVPSLKIIKMEDIEDESI